jgi:single-strand DNA-binding protein
MAGNLNKVLLIGNVGKDPEIRSTQDGREIANIVLATSETWKDKATGEKKEKTEWHRVVVFSEGLVGIVKNYIKKGSRLYVEGTMKTRKWTDSSGQEKYTTEVVLQGYNSTLTILDTRSMEGSAERSESPSKGGAPSLMEDLDDEIPF